MVFFTSCIYLHWATLAPCLFDWMICVAHLNILLSACKYRHSYESAQFLKTTSLPVPSTNKTHLHHTLNPRTTPSHPIIHVFLETANRTKHVWHLHPSHPRCPTSPPSIFAWHCPTTTFPQSDHSHALCHNAQHHKYRWFYANFFHQSHHPN